jgi:hypothetical protein
MNNNNIKIENEQGTGEMLRFWEVTADMEGRRDRSKVMLNAPSTAKHYPITIGDRAINQHFPNWQGFYKGLFRRLFPCSVQRGYTLATDMARPPFYRPYLVAMVLQLLLWDPLIQEHEHEGWLAGHGNMIILGRS